MRVRQGIKPLVFSEEEHTLTVQYSNRGEPFVDGVQFTFDSGWKRQNQSTIWVLLDAEEVRTLRDKLSEFLGEQPTPK